MSGQDPPSDSGTRIGDGSRSFPTTSPTLLARARGDDAQAARDALSTLLHLYWKPVYWFIRHSWRKSNEDAKDLTQEFFADMIEREALLQHDPGIGCFRGFLKTSLLNFLRQDHRDAGRRKRGGGARVLSLEGAAEGPIDPPSPDAPAEKAFDDLWRQNLVSEGLRRLKETLTHSGRARQYDVFAAYDLTDAAPTYLELGQRFQITEDQVRRALRDARQALRQILRQLVLDTMHDPGDADNEMKLLFGRG